MLEYSGFLADTNTDAYTKLNLSSIVDLNNPKPQIINDKEYTAQPIDLMDEGTLSMLTEELKIEDKDIFAQDIENIMDYTTSAFIVRDENSTPLYLWTDMPSKNYKHEKTQPTDTLVLHYTAANLKSALDTFIQKTDVSIHYIVGKSGIIINLIPDNKIAWHAGKSSWQGREKVNDYSVGIEIINQGWGTPDGNWEEFTGAQKKSVCLLSKDISTHHNIPRDRIVGHQDVAPDRKVDPGPLFFWDEMAEHGAGISTGGICDRDSKVICKFNDENDKVRSMQEKLSEFGYKIKIDGKYDEETAKVVNAFTCHFSQEERLALEKISGKNTSNPWTTVCDTKIDLALKEKSDHHIDI
ncbi:N-acetylmuramoyl-L-alanine amidase [Candidatus Xenohaliotis californiensis]|uniref:N-acetylmuramoyl-L-alanine amidase n=1 Tax=Candidatus Xenohaliotis californiensis TaxID=84677 RepID=A0ABM9N947_9RICK|nr:N-acetylmuramoyl-L-alanine amidase [Candidatus Xenohaliotis californiensis]